MLAASGHLGLKDTGTERGRGVFALARFEPDELVEACPIVIVRTPFRALPDELKTIVFNWGFLSGGPDLHAIVLGHGSLYNHDNPSNLRYVADPATDLLRFFAVRRIETGEELTINYNAHGGGHIWHDNKWFERMNITPVAGHAPREKP